MTEGIPPTLHV